MEILSLLLLYLLSQKPDFADGLKPLLSSLKNSEETLKFLGDLNKFSELFASLSKMQQGGEKPKEKNEPKETKEKPPETESKKSDSDEKKKEKPQSPTVGIADDFIQKSLDAYFKRR